MNLRELIGIGNKTGKLIFPIIIISIILNIVFPSFFLIGGPSSLLLMISTSVLIIGLVNCIWSQVLIIHVPKHKLITSGPFSIVKHPLYTGVSLLVIPWIGFILNTWLGVVAGIIIYIILRMYAPEEKNYQLNLVMHG